MKNPKIALVYDRVNTAYGGAEQVLQALHEVFPKAPLFTSVYEPTSAQWAKVFHIKTSFLQKFSWARNHHRLLALLMPLAFETLDLSAYDIVISITSAEAKGIKTQPDQLHICYLLTPSRYLYSHKPEYQQTLPSWPIFSSLVQLSFRYLHWWDQTAAHRPDVIIPIAQRIARRTKRYYGRETDQVIYPPVKISRSATTKLFKPETQLMLAFEAVGSKPYYLTLARLVAYKKIDLAIKACMEMKKHIMVVGVGPEFQKLQKIADKSPYVHLLGTISETNVRYLLEHCRALILPGQEDFGISVLEATACGKPVVINKESGVAELLTDGKTAIFITKSSVYELTVALTRLEKKRWNPAIMKDIARQHSWSVFKKDWHNTVTRMWREYGK